MIKLLYAVIGDQGRGGDEVLLVGDQEQCTDLRRKLQIPVTVCTVRLTPEGRYAHRVRSAVSGGDLGLYMTAADKKRAAAL